MTLRVLVCGGRHFGRVYAGIDGSKQGLVEYQFILDTLNRLSLDWPKRPEDEYGNWLPDVVVISGKAPGVDTVAIDWAVVNWCQFEEYPANWKKYGKRAGYLRNRQMLIEGKPDLVVAFPGGPGTEMMKKLAREHGLEVKEIAY